MSVSCRVKEYWKAADRLFAGELNAKELAAEVRFMKLPLFERHGAGLEDGAPERMAAVTEPPGRGSPR